MPATMSVQSSFFYNEIYYLIHYRETGIAFDLHDTDYDVPNFTLASGELLKTVSVQFVLLNFYYSHYLLLFFLR